MRLSVVACLPAKAGAATKLFKLICLLFAAATTAHPPARQQKKIYLAFIGIIWGL